MSMQDFREIFQREISQMTARLQQKSLEHSRVRSTEASPASTTRWDAGSQVDLGSSLGGYGPEPRHVGELQRLATEMAETILDRVSSKTAGWVDADTSGVLVDEPAAAVALRRSAEADSAAAGEERRTRLKELEEKLRRKRAEEAQLRVELVSKCKVDSELVLQVQEKKLEELRCRASVPQSAETQPEEATEMQREFAEQVARIHNSMALARDAVGRLENRAKAIEGIEIQQRRTLPAMEVRLAHAKPYSIGDPLDDWDSPLVEAIRRGEQVCKRMRRSLAGA